ncbi:MAG: hypothetical protein ACT4OK_10980 [Gemmobacter sp.]
MFDFLRGIFPGRESMTPVVPPAPVLTNPASIPMPTMTPAAVAGATAGASPGISGDELKAAVPQNFWQKLGGLEGMGSIAQGLASLGNLYGAIQGIGIARDQLKLSKRAFETNLANQTQSYNTALEDRIRSRYVAEGKDASAADEYLKQHSL